MDEAPDATRRTQLANERTQLAWWRTGMTALAVALAVGRVVPLLGETAHQWAYTSVGVGFAGYGLALIVYGRLRSRQVRTSLARGEGLPGEEGAMSALAAAGILLALATAILVIIE